MELLVTETEVKGRIVGFGSLILQTLTVFSDVLGNETNTGRQVLACAWSHHSSLFFGTHSCVPKMDERHGQVLLGGKRGVALGLIPRR